MKTRIGVLGIGGVGGYFGGLLAKAYLNSEEVEILFIARGAHQAAIAKSGLKITSDESEIVVFPKLVSNDPSIIGKLDYLICATKTYDIEESLEGIQKCVTKNTIFLPLYNGVDASERIRNRYPDNEVLDGCVYLVAMTESAGVIKKIGNYEKLFFGSNTASTYKLKALQAIFENAGIESYLVADIETTSWEKFIFISALATATSYLNQNVGEILDDPSSRAFYLGLRNEITLIAAVKGLQLPEDIIMQTILKLEKTPHNATSSMHRDVLAERKFELASLTEYVVKLGLEYEVETPNYEQALKKLARLKVF